MQQFDSHQFFSFSDLWLVLRCLFFAVSANVSTDFLLISSAVCCSWFLRAMSVLLTCRICLSYSVAQVHISLSNWSSSLFSGSIPELCPSFDMFFKKFPFNTLYLSRTDLLFTENFGFSRELRFNAICSQPIPLSRV